MIRKVLLAALLPLAACGNGAELPSKADLPGPDEGVFPSIMRMTGDIIDAEGVNVGSVNLLGGPNGVMLEVSVDTYGLETGWHGLHLHQVGNCDDLGVFTNSGGHVGKVDGGHGLLNPKGPEGGDLPNIWVNADGAAGYEAFSSLFSLSDLADEDGAALIIHAGRDDHMTQPIGGAGPRVACAVIR